MGVACWGKMCVKSHRHARVGARLTRRRRVTSAACGGIGKRRRRCCFFFTAVEQLAVGQQKRGLASPTRPHTPPVRHTRTGRNITRPMGVPSHPPTPTDGVGLAAALAAPDAGNVACTAAHAAPRLAVSPLNVVLQVALDGVDRFADGDGLDAAAVEAHVAARVAALGGGADALASGAEASPTHTLSPPTTPRRAPFFDTRRTTGDLALGEGDAVESFSNFASALSTACITTGRWAFDVELRTAGIAQLGWATSAAGAAFTNEEGTGDAPGSYAYDGRRVRRWGGGRAPRPYGAAWTAGDTITVALDADAGIVTFWRNGTPLGPAFRGVERGEAVGGYHAAVSLSRGERVTVNGGGAAPLAAQLPPGYRPLMPPPAGADEVAYLVSATCELCAAAAGRGGGGLLDGRAARAATAALAAAPRAGGPSPADEVAAILGAMLVPCLTTDPGCIRYCAAASVAPALTALAARGGARSARAAFAALRAMLSPMLSANFTSAVLDAFARTVRTSQIEVAAAGAAASAADALATVRALAADPSTLTAWAASPGWHAALEDLLLVRTPTPYDLAATVLPPHRAAAAAAAAVGAPFIPPLVELTTALAQLEAHHVALLADLAAAPAPGAYADASSPGGRGWAASARTPSTRLDAFLTAVARRNRGAMRTVPPPGMSDPSALVSLFHAGLALAAPALRDAEHGGGPLAAVAVGALAVGGGPDAGDRYGGDGRLGGAVGYVLSALGDATPDAAGAVVRAARVPVAATASAGRLSPPPRVPTPTLAACTPPAGGAHSALLSPLAQRGGSVSPGSSPSGGEDGGYATPTSLPSVDGSEGEDDDDGAWSSAASSASSSGDDDGPSPTAAVPPHAVASLVDRLILLYRLAVGPSIKDAGTHAQQLSLVRAQNVADGILADGARHAAWQAARLFSRAKAARLRSLAAHAARVLAASARAPRASPAGLALPTLPDAYAEVALDGYHSAARVVPFLAPNSARAAARGAAANAAAALEVASAASLLVADDRVISPDVRDMAWQALGALVVAPRGRDALDGAPDVSSVLPRALLAGLASPAWVPSANVLASLVTPVGLAPPVGSPAPAPRVLAALASALTPGAASDAALDRAFSAQSWALTEAAAAARDGAGGTPPGAAARRRRAAALDLAAALARAVEFAASAAPSLFAPPPHAPHAVTRAAALHLGRAVDAAGFVLVPGPGGSGLPAAGPPLVASAAGTLAALAAARGVADVAARLIATPAAAGLTALAAAGWAPLRSDASARPEADDPRLTTLTSLVAALAAAKAVPEPVSRPPPDEFIDPITSAVMDDPVVLPASRARVDRSTLDRLLLAPSPSDPFSRAPITARDVVADMELKGRIEAWKNQGAVAMEE